MLGQAQERHPAALKVIQGVDQVPERATKAVQAPDHDGVAWAELLEQGVQCRSVRELAGRLVDEDPVAAGRGEGVVLKGLILLEGGDPAVPEPGSRWSQYPSAQGELRHCFE